MVHAIGQRPTHYDTLGVEPTATQEEIARAFARQLHRPQALGQLGSIGLAYETLRDPDRRKSYDSSIGLAPERQTAPAFKSFAAWSMTPTVRPIVTSQLAVLAPKPTPESFVPSAPVESEPFVVAPEPEPREVPDSTLAIQPSPPSGDTFEWTLPEGEPSTVAWRKVAAVTVPVVVAAIMVGAWSGRDASASTASDGAPEREVTLSLPPAQPLPDMQPAKSETGARNSEQPAVRRPAPRAIAAVTPKRPLPRPIELTPEEERELAGNAFVDSVSKQVQPAAEALHQSVETSVVATAAMPLPDRVIARTIHRIGYSCGQVASTDPIGPDAGVFKVTCTSGHSYRAQPVRGRYRFKRLGG